MVSAVLHFGNLKFKQERNSDQALLPDNTVAQKIAKLTGMSVSDFTKALLKPKIKTGREFTVRSQNKAQVSVSLSYVILAEFLPTFFFTLTSVYPHLVQPYLDPIALSMHYYRVVINEQSRLLRN